MTLPASSETCIDCPLCGQQFRRVTSNGDVSFFADGTAAAPGSRCPFDDQIRTVGRLSASHPQTTPDGCFKDLVVKIHELHQLERRAYDGALVAHAGWATPPPTGMCTAATPAAISYSRQAFVTISARLATFMRDRDDPEHMCPACGHACCEPTRGGGGLCADCVASGLTG